MSLLAVGHGVCLSGHCWPSGGSDNYHIPSRGPTDKPHDVCLSADQRSARELYDNGGMSPSSLVAIRTVHHLVPPAIRWRFVWRATSGPLTIAITNGGLPAIYQWATRRNHLSVHRRPTSWCIWQWEGLC